MKRIWTLAVLALVGTALPVFAQEDGHRLTALWKEQEAASRADLPRKEAEILSRIKREAAQKRFAADFYDAATGYVNAVQRYNWKERSALLETLSREVQDYHDPLVTFLWMESWTGADTDSLWRFVQAQESGLRDCRRELHRGVDALLGGSVKPFIRNDREYTLWRLVQRRGAAGNPVMEALLQEVSGVYPSEALAQYFQLDAKSWKAQEAAEEKAAWEVLAARYAGKAFAVYPRARLLRLQLRELNGAKAGGEAYRKLWAEARALEKERKASREKMLVAGCTYPAHLMETLTESALWIQTEGGEARVLLRNLSGASLNLSRDKISLRQWQLTNAVNSFYVPDTLKVVLPALEDGQYLLEAQGGKLEASAQYTQYTLSVATRQDSRGRCIYVADYESGIPLRSITVRLCKSGREVAQARLALDGFTPLPEALVRQMAADTRSSWELRVESGSRRAPALYLGNDYSRTEYPDQPRCHFYKDRGAYNPGDTLQFKAIVYKGDPARSLVVLKKHKVEVRLRDSEDHVLQTLQLTTNAWGSVSGRFSIPMGIRGGRFELEAVGLGYDWFRVDEFVAPTFSLSFDPVDRLLLVGSQVPVTGTLESYAGHPLGGARLHLKVSRYNSVVLDTDLPIREGRRFSGAFTAAESGYYRAEATVTEATGETHSFSHGWYISDRSGVRVSVSPEADAELEPVGEDGLYFPKYVVSARDISLRLQATDGAGNDVPEPVSYTLKDAHGALLLEGVTPSGAPVSVALPCSGRYELTAAGQTFRLYCLPEGERTLDRSVRRVFVAGPLEVAPGGEISARVGSAQKDLYGVVTLFGEKRQVLLQQAFRVADGAIDRLAFPYLDAYPDAVRLQVVAFTHGACMNVTREYRRAQDKFALPLGFTRFQDKARPGCEYSFTLQTLSGVEVLAAAWDKSLEQIGANEWPLVRAWDFSVPEVPVNAVCGQVGGYPVGRFVAFGRNQLMAKSVGDAVPFQLVEEKAGFGGEPQPVDIREKFSPALTFQPHLRPGKDGKLTFRFHTSDKLSTYIVRVLAHDTKMHNALEQKEMLITLPVKVALLEPRYLYVGDRYEAAVSVSSIAEEPVSGTVRFTCGSSVAEVPVRLAPGETLTRSFPCEAADEGPLTLTACFLAEGFSDAVRVTVPVYPAAQTLTEAHSAVLRAGASREALLAALRGRFVNVPGDQAACTERSLREIIDAELAAHAEPQREDVLSLLQAWYVQRSAELLAKVLACRNADGGFGWFEGMRSSPVLTAVVLEQLYRAGEAGLEELSASVQYLDLRQFSAAERLPWRGALSLEQYLYVRSLYRSVPFTWTPSTAAEKTLLKEFRREARSFLVPSRREGRGLQGRVLSKARRLLTLRALQEDDAGAALLKSWGVSTGCASRLRASAQADVRSLLEYAVEHRDGGWYFPNAVLPWRGLLESEAYAHALLCQLLEGEKAAGDSRGQSPLKAYADGIRLWLVLQRETQQWTASPAFVDAVSAVRGGSPELLETRVMALSASYTKPFHEVQAAGNGFTIERRFLRDGVELQPGDSVRVGERIRAQYEIWNGENRSFVRVVAGREAALQPVAQLSGHLSPGGYRAVRAGATEYYFDSYPEEKSTLIEEFFVVRSGCFQAPVLTVESLYAPHYRANDGFRAPLVCQ